MSMQEANATIDRWQAQIAQAVQQTKQTAAQAATTAASGVSKGAFGSRLWVAGLALRSSYDTVRQQALASARE